MLNLSLLLKLSFIASIALAFSPPNAADPDGAESGKVLVINKTLIKETCSEGCGALKRKGKRRKCRRACNSCLKECRSIKKESVKTCSKDCKGKKKEARACRRQCKSERATTVRNCVNVCKEDSSSNTAEEITPTFPFPSNISSLNEESTIKYSSVDEFKEDVKEAAWFLVNEIVESNSFKPSYCYERTGGLRARTGSTETLSMEVNGHGTNNQEEDVEEGDEVVSDGETVYAAHDDTLIVLNAKSGEIISKVTMPSAEELLAQIDGASTSSYYPKPEIKSLVLHNDRLLVVVNGYEKIFLAKAGIDYYEKLFSGSTHLRVYDTSELKDGKAEPLASSDAKGEFLGVRALGGSNVHVVTSSSLYNYGSMFRKAFDRYQNPFCPMEDEEYFRAVYNKAKEEVIPSFVDKVVAELMLEDGSFPDLVRLSHWPSGESERTFEYSIMSTAVLVHSFSLSSVTETLSVSSAGALLPASSYNADIYGSANAILVALNAGYPVYGTRFVGFQMDGAMVLSKFVGSTDGSVMNSHALDILEDERVLRVATTDSSADANHVIMLKVPEESGLLTVLGRIKLGKENERFTAVRFYDNIAYAFTFEIIDPLYVLDLTNPEDPVVLAELEIPESSSYIHSMNDDNSLILTIGTTGQWNGNVLATVFDVSDPSNPFVAAQLDITEDVDPESDGGWSDYSGSTSLSNFKATRYVDGHLIVPAYTSSYGGMLIFDTVAMPWNTSDAWDDGYDAYDSSPGSRRLNYGSGFSGFAKYKVNATAIEPECPIALSSVDWYGDYYDYSNELPTRSMIFDGMVMTMDGDTIQSHNMNTCEEAWVVDVTAETED